MNHKDNGIRGIIMAICSMCNDTGRMLVLERFCTCTIGKVQQRVARGAARAERLKEQEKAENRKGEKIGTSGIIPGRT